MKRCQAGILNLSNLPKSLFVERTTLLPHRILAYAATNPGRLTENQATADCVGRILAFPKLSFTLFSPLRSLFSLPLFPFAAIVSDSQ
jgi:hypothetical protein